MLVRAGARISESDHSAAGRKRDVPSATPANTGYRPKRKVELLLQLIRDETKLVDACREHDLKQSEVAPMWSGRLGTPIGRAHADVAR